jgi:hypothetical protein
LITEVLGVDVDSIDVTLGSVPQSHSSPDDRLSIGSLGKLPAPTGAGGHEHFGLGEGSGVLVGSALISDILGGKDDIAVVDSSSQTQSSPENRFAIGSFGRLPAPTGAFGHKQVELSAGSAVLVGKALISDVLGRVDDSGSGGGKAPASHEQSSGGRLRLENPAGGSDPAPWGSGPHLHVGSTLISEVLAVEEELELHIELLVGVGVVERTGGGEYSKVGGDGRGVLFAL